MLCDYVGVLPQCVLHSLIHCSYYNHNLFCVKNYSYHLRKMFHLTETVSCDEADREKGVKLPDC